MTAPTPAPEADLVRRTAAAFQQSRALLTAFDLGLFTAIKDGPTAAEEAAARVGADPRATERLLNALAAMGFVEKRDGLFINAPAAAAHLVEGAPGYMAELGHMSGLYGRWASLTEAVRAGTSVLPSHFAANDPEDMERFIRAMNQVAKAQAPVLAGRVPLAGAARLLDVGGGSGAYSIALAKANPELRCTILDLPAVTPLTQRYVAEAGLSKRVTTIDGDYRTDALGSGYDAVLLSAVIHINGPRENAWLARKAFEALNPGGRLIIRDFVMDEARTAPARGTLFALNMLVNTELGDVYTEVEIADWLAEAGFADVARIDLGPETAAMVGTRPA